MTALQKQQDGPFRLPIPAEAVCNKYGIDGALWLTLTEAIWPNAKTSEAIILALSYCHARKLDPLKKPVHIVPIWNSKLKKNVEGVWPSIDEQRTTAMRTNEYGGCDVTEFGDHTEKEFTGKVNRDNAWKEIAATVAFPEWCRITVYRFIQGNRVPFPGPKVFWLETYGRMAPSKVPNDKWQSAPSYMLEKCAEAAALRKAFPEECGGPTAEEMEGKIVDIAGAPAVQNDPPPRPQLEDFQHAQSDPAEMYSLIDEFGEAVGEYSKFDLVAEAVKRINELASLTGGVTRLEAFMTANENFEVFEPRSDERKDIASVYNAAREQCAASEADEATAEPTEAEDQNHDAATE